MKVWILEDEELAGIKLQKLTQKLLPDAEVADPIDSVSEAREALKNGSPDLLLADIHLSDGLSFEIFESHQIDCPIIFTTAFDEYALKAFDLMSVDYLLKPISKELLQKALKKLDRFNSGGKQALAILDKLRSLQAGEPNFQERFLVPEGQHFKSMRDDEIAHFMGDGKFTFVIDRSGREYLIDHNLSELEELLNPKKFFRINRSIITHIDSIMRVHPFGQSRLLLDLSPPSKKEATVSADKNRAFKEWMGS